MPDAIASTVASRRDWIAMMAARCATLADGVRGSTEKGAAMRLFCFERLAARFAAELEVGAPSPAQQGADNIAVLQERLATVSPREHPHYPGIIINTGPIMRGLAADIAARLGSAAPSAPVAPSAPTPLECDAAPSGVSAQLEMFA